MLEEKHRHSLIVVASLVISIGPVICSACGLVSPADGTRGGAFASALSFLALFANEPYGLLTLEDQKKRANRHKLLHELMNKPIPDSTSTSEEIEAIRSAIKIDVLGQQRQNRSIAISAGCGTVFWGFGDLFAEWIKGLFYLCNLR